MGFVQQPQPDAERHRGGGSGPARPGRPVRRGAMGRPGVRERRVPVHLDPGHRPAALAARHVRPARAARRGERGDIRRRSVLVVPDSRNGGTARRSGRGGGVRSS